MAKKKKRRGHYCKICGECKPNEKFSGKGHARHICTKCWSLPKETQTDMMRCNRIEHLIFKYSLSRKDWELLEKYAEKYKDREPGQFAQSILEDRRGQSDLPIYDEENDCWIEDVDLPPRTPLTSAELEKESEAWLRAYIGEDTIDHDSFDIAIRLTDDYVYEYFISLRDNALRNNIASLSKELQEKIKEDPF